MRNRLWNSTGFFLVFWAVHYFPFYIMSRQLFIHHYLPSHLASALVAGSVLSFVLSETVNYPISVRGPATRLKPSTYADVGMKGPIIVGLFVIAMFVMFCYIAPLTYGTPGYVVLLTQACGFVTYVLYADWMATKLTRGGSSRRGPCTLRRSPRTSKKFPRYDMDVDASLAREGGGLSVMLSHIALEAGPPVCT